MYNMCSHAHIQDEVGVKVEQIKRMRIEMKEKAQDLREKDKLYQQVCFYMSIHTYIYTYI